MLRITQQSSADSAKRYYSAADYYAEGQEAVGLWGGGAAERLGLSGRVGKEAFGLLCENRHPKTGGPLTARSKDDRTVGYDFTWSVPKSVSLLHALGGDEALLEAFRASVRETMQDVEREMKVRVRKKGRNEERTTANMCWAEFIHTTSRPVDGLPDPQLHAHCFVFNSTWDDEEQQWKAGQFRDLKRDAPYWQAAFRARLADRLQDLGYALDRTRDDFEIAGIPADVLRRFSRRTEKIEELARELGIDDPDRKALLGATSREQKNHDLTWDQLQQAWRERLTPTQRDGIERIVRDRSLAARPGPTGREKEAVDFAIAHRFERESVADEKRLLADALGHGLGEVTVEGVRRELARRPLIVRECRQRRLVTTPEVLAEEDRLVAFAREGRGTRKPLGTGDRPLKRDWLGPGQRRAVEHVLSSRDRVVLIRGAAGTGKTSLMQEAVEAIREGGHEVVVLAPSASASRDVLRKEGFAEADTVARFLADEPMQRKAANQVVWVDEAGLLGARDVAALFAVARRQDARVVLSGDRFQHGSVGRGAVLRLLEEQAGVPAASVTEIQRQKGAYKKAVGLLSEGEALKGFDALDRLGWVREVPTGERYLELAWAYLRATGEKKRGRAKTALVISPTHAEAERIHAAIRRERAARGELGPERELAVWRPAHLTEAERGEPSHYSPGDMLQFHRNAKGHRSGERVLHTGRPLPLDQAARFQVYRPGTLRLAAGDRVRITANGKTKDGRHRLDNGALFNVEGFTARGDVVLDNGWIIDRDFGHLAQGYVVTSQASQGKTVDEVIIGQSSLSFPATGREQFYVSASRGRHKALVFTDDKAALREAVARAERRLTATELVGGKQPRRDRLRKHMAFQRRLAADWPPSPGAAERGRGGRQREVERER